MRLTADEACTLLLLVVVSGKLSNETVVWQLCSGWAVASDGIAGAVESREIRSRAKKGAEGCLPRPDGKTVVSSFGTDGAIFTKASVAGKKGTLLEAQVLKRLFDFNL
jgi:hypothetical protein